ncbi:hypothetical protein RCF98_00575 [Thiothrix lacustris]|uniref:Uncharacterized protein n=1 Tax=Thiothrix lacustris TaxID=525917 RepID=A0ABY9MQD2_9GAMM|nr:hypothetical protein [Thiothrix lacustris]WML90863.1 hypothetical protein RCF98_00575 [Thiothrix lacustris]
MADKKKPLHESGNQKRIEGADYSNTSDHKQRRKAESDGDV